LEYVLYKGELRNTYNTLDIKSKEKRPRSMDGGIRALKEIECDIVAWICLSQGSFLLSAHLDKGIESISDIPKADSCVSYNLFNAVVNMNTNVVFNNALDQQ
jgi:hypothetical protein